LNRVIEIVFPILGEMVGLDRLACATTHDRQPAKITWHRRTSEDTPQQAIDSRSSS
jgi:hypothetical protein